MWLRATVFSAVHPAARLTRHSVWGQFNNGMDILREAFAFAKLAFEGVNLRVDDGKAFPTLYLRRSLPVHLLTVCRLV